MSRPETAMEPSMEEILASIRKIIAEEPAGKARPKPEDRPAPLAPERASASLSLPLDESPGASRGAATSGPFGPAAAAPGSKPMPKSSVPMSTPQREENPFDKPDPFQAPAAASHESRSQSGAASSQPPPRTDVASTRPALSMDSEMLFGRLAEALRGGPVAGPAIAPSVKVPPATAVPVSSDLDDLDDLLDEHPASGASSSRTPDAGEASATSTPTVDFNAIFPRRGGTLAETTAAGKPEADAFETTQKPHFGKGLSTLDDELADILAADEVTDDDLTSAEGHAAGELGVSAQPEDAGIIDLHEATAGASESASNASEIDAALQDLEGEEAAKSAFGALMAGLAASSKPELRKLGATVAPEKPESATVQAATEISSAEAAGSAKSVATSGAEALETAASSVEVSALTKPRVVAANLPIAGIGAGATTTPEQTEFPPASMSQGPSEAAPAAPALPSADATAGDAQSVPGAQPAIGLQQAAAATGLAAALAVPAGSAVGVRTVEDIVAELLRPMLREWLAENMPRMVEKALRIELAEGLKTVNQPPTSRVEPD